MSKFLIPLIFVVMCSYSYTFAQDPLKKYRWNNRIVLLFANSPDNDFLIRQEKILEKEAEGMKDRDLLVIRILPESEKQLQELRGKYKTRDSFTFVLIGKDGGEKKTSYSPVQTDELFALIDSMPMRKAEMRNEDQ